MSAALQKRGLSATELLAPDVALPQRDLLLDDESMAPRLSSLLGRGGIEFQSCLRRRAKYQFGRSLRVLYEVQANGRSQLVSARAYSPDTAPPRLEEIEGEGRSPLRGIVHDRSLHTTFSLFPNDRKIKHLSLLAANAASFAQRSNASWVNSRLVSYTPEKSATAQCLNARNCVIAYAKVYADNEEVRRVYQVYQGLSAAIKRRASDQQIGEAFHIAQSENLILLKPIAGERISNLSARKRTEAMRHLGIALAELHRLEIPVGLPTCKRFAPEQLKKAAEIIGRALPKVSKLASDLARLLCSDRPLPEKLVCLHGDVHPKNGIAHKEHVALIDFDQAAFGDSNADLGSMLAAIRYDRITGAITHDVAAELADRFLSGYRQSGFSPRDKTLRWHIAAACLSERALRAVTRIRVEGLPHVAELLLDAKSLLSTRTHKHEL